MDQHKQNTRKDRSGHLAWQEGDLILVKSTPIPVPLSSELEKPKENPVSSADQLPLDLERKD
jgi:hypothetical protein